MEELKSLHYCSRLILWLAIWSVQDLPFLKQAWLYLNLLSRTLINMILYVVLSLVQGEAYLSIIIGVYHVSFFRWHSSEAVFPVLMVFLCFPYFAYGWLQDGWAQSLSPPPILLPLDCPPLVVCISTLNMCCWGTGFFPQQIFLRCWSFTLFLKTASSASSVRISV